MRLAPLGAIHALGHEIPNQIFIAGVRGIYYGRESTPVFAFQIGIHAFHQPFGYLASLVDDGEIQNGVSLQNDSRHVVDVEIGILQQLLEFLQYVAAIQNFRGFPQNVVGDLPFCQFFLSKL